MADYQERFLKVIAYIDLHLDEVLSVERLSQVACLSKFHFHRQFSLFLGQSLSGYIQQLRFKRAAYQLAYRKSIKVIDIALENGYESPEAFSRAFKKFSGQSPTGFRNTPDWSPWHDVNGKIKKLREIKMEKENLDYNVKIIEFKDLQVAIRGHRGAPEGLGKTIGQFIEWRKLNNLPPDKSRTFNLIYDDPAVTAPDAYRFDLCASVRSEIPPNDFGIINGSIPGGRCAMVRHIGSDTTIDTVIRFLYGDWLNKSGEELRDFPLFLERISFFPDVPEHEMITDIYLPVK